MKNSLSQASALLELTRDAHDPPSAAARERVRQRIAFALAGAVASSGASAAQAASATKLDRLAASKGASSINLFAKFALVTSVTMMGGAIWLVLPHRAPSAREPVTIAMRMTDAPELIAPPPPVMSVEPLRERSMAKDERALAPTRSEIPAAQPESAPPHVRSDVAAPAPEPAVVAPAARRHATRASARSSLSEEESLAAEVSLLHHAERALSGGDAELALSMLQTHRDQFPHALLREEQAGLVALARCTVDADDTRPARSFLARHPDSMLNARIRQACALSAP